MVDVAQGKGTELIIGEQDGVICLSPDGTVLWKDKGCTDGYYLSDVAICDLEVRVDPENSIVEKNEENNKLITSVKIDTDNIMEPIFFRESCSLILLFIISNSFCTDCYFHPKKLWIF